MGQWHYLKMVVLGWMMVLGTATAWGYSGGSGTVGAPYQIATTGDLQSIGTTSTDWDKHFILTANLDLTGVAMTPIGNNGTKFTGSFSGNGFVLSNLTIDLPTTDYVGLFGYVKSTFDPNTISNLGLIDPVITGKNRVGSLAGLMEKGNFSKCFSSGGIINGDQDVGGLLGYNFTTGTLNDCYTTGAVTGSIWIVGGLVGHNYKGTISNCYASCLVNNGVANSNVGGLIGKKTATDFVSGCFWDTQVSGQSTSAGGTGKTTAQMKMAVTYVCWGASESWTIDEGVEPPHLLWEGASGTLISAVSYSGGTGTLNDPYQIGSVSQLLWLGCDSAHWNKHYKLIADLDLAGTSMTPIGTFATPFSGSFDGNGFALSNLTLNLPTTNTVGLFSVVNSAFDPTIYDLSLINPDVDGVIAGSLVGSLSEGTLIGCHAVGGRVDGVQSVGGLVGSSFGFGMISNSSASSMVTGATADTGGLVGYNNVGVISACIATGSVEGTSTIVGGLVGRNNGHINNSYATGSVTGFSTAGGLVGSNNGMISDCYCLGAVFFPINPPTLTLGTPLFTRQLA